MPSVREPCGDAVDEGVVGEAGEGEVEVDGGGLAGVLALGGGACGPVELVGAEAELRGLLLGLFGFGDVLEEPADAEGNRFFGQR